MATAADLPVGFGPLWGWPTWPTASRAPRSGGLHQNNLTRGLVSSDIYIGAPVDQTSAFGHAYGFNGAVWLVPDQLANTFDANGNPIPHCWAANASDAACLTGHVDPRLIMDVGVMNANQPASDDGDRRGRRVFLTLTTWAW